MKTKPQTESRLKLGYGPPIFGGALLSIILVFETLDVLSFLCFHSVFQELSLKDPMRVFISLYLFMGFSSVALVFIGVYLLRKGYTKVSAFGQIIAAVTALITLGIPLAYGSSLPILVILGTIISTCLILIGAGSSLTIPPTTKPEARLLTSIEVSTVAVFSALYAIMILMLVIPSPTGGYTHIGDTIVFMAALLLGYKVGGLVGILGSVVADLYTGYTRWYVSILAHGLEGLVAGFAKGRPIIVQVVMCVIGGFLMASTYFLINVFIKGFPLAIVSYARDLFVQAAVSIVLGIIIANIVKKALPQFRR